MADTLLDMKQPTVVVLLALLVACMGCGEISKAEAAFRRACTARDGRWMCDPKLKPTTMMATQSTSYPSPNWNVPLWVVDRNNNSGCAKDTNSCTQTSCSGGLGPCRTAGQISQRWGCTNILNECVELTAAVTIEFMSGDSDNTDPWGFDGIVEADRGGSLTIKADTPAQTTGSTASCTQQSVSGTTMETLTSAALAGATVPTSLVSVTTGGQTTKQWCMNKPGGNSCTTTTAQTDPALPLTTFAPTIGTCTGAGGDAIAVAAPFRVNLVSVRPTVTGFSFADAGVPRAPVLVQNMIVYDPAGAGSGNSIRWGSNVSGLEVEFQRALQIVSVGGDTINSGCINCLAAGGMGGGRISSGHNFLWSGGGFFPTAGLGIAWNFTGQGMVLDGFTWDAVNLAFPEGVQVASMVMASPDFGSGVTSTFNTTTYFSSAAGGYTNLGVACSNCAPPVVWGNTISIINITGMGRFDAIHGGFGAGWTGINAGSTAGSQLALNLNGLGTGCALVNQTIGTGTYGVFACGTSLINTNVDLATGGGGFGQHVYSAIAGNGAQFQGGLQ